MQRYEIYVDNRSESITLARKLLREIGIKQINRNGMRLIMKRVDTNKKFLNEVLKRGSKQVPTMVSPNGYMKWIGVKNICDFFMSKTQGKARISEDNLDSYYDREFFAIDPRTGKRVPKTEDDKSENGLNTDDITRRTMQFQQKMMAAPQNDEEVFDTEHGRNHRDNIFDDDQGGGGRAETPGADNYDEDAVKRFMMGDD